MEQTRSELQGMFIGQSAVTFDEANFIFSVMKGMEEFHWGWIVDGCAARAHLAFRVISDAGLRSQKIWAFSAFKLETGDNLLRPKVVVRNGLRGWITHCAATVRVLSGETDILYALDPATAPMPQTIDEWFDDLRHSGARRGLMDGNIYEPGRFAVRGKGLEIIDFTRDDDLSITKLELARIARLHGRPS